MAPSVHAASILSMIRQSWRYCFDSVDKHGHIFLSHLQSGAIRSWLGLRNLRSAFHGVGCSLDSRIAIRSWVGLRNLGSAFLRIAWSWEWRISFTLESASLFSSSHSSPQLQLGQLRPFNVEMWGMEERKCYWGRMSRLERGKSGFTMGVAHPPYGGDSEEGHRRVRHDTRTQHIDTCVFAHADTQHVSVLPWELLNEEVI